MYNIVTHNLLLNDYVCIVASYAYAANMSSAIHKAGLDHSSALAECGKFASSHTPIAK